MSKVSGWGITYTVILSIIDKMKLVETITLGWLLALHYLVGKKKKFN